MSSETVAGTADTARRPEEAIQLLEKIFDHTQTLIGRRPRHERIF